MPSSVATRRASSTAESEQQPPCRASSAPSPRGHCCSVTPTTSWPCRRRGAAATLESTPPERATAILTPLAPGSAPGHRRHDGDLVGLPQRRVQSAAEADVLVVQEEVDELARLAVVVEQAALEAREPGVELVDRGAQVGRLHADGRRAPAQVPEGARDAEHRHVAKLLDKARRVRSRGT